MFEGNAFKRRPWRSAHSAALKLKFSSLVSVQLTFFPLSVAWFCLQMKTHNGNVHMLYSYYIVTYQKMIENDKFNYLINTFNIPLMFEFKVP